MVAGDSSVSATVSSRSGSMTVESNSIMDSDSGTAIECSTADDSASTIDSESTVGSGSTLGSGSTGGGVQQMPLQAVSMKAVANQQRKLHHYTSVHLFSCCS